MLRANLKTAIFAIYYSRLMQTTSTSEQNINFELIVELMIYILQTRYLYFSKATDPQDHDRLRKFFTAKDLIADFLEILITGELDKFDKCNGLTMTSLRKEFEKDAHFGIKEALSNKNLKVFSGTATKTEDKSSFIYTGQTIPLHDICYPQSFIDLDENKHGRKGHCQAWLNFRRDARWMWNLFFLDCTGIYDLIYNCDKNCIPRPYESESMVKNGKIKHDEKMRTIYAAKEEAKKLRQQK